MPNTREKLIELIQAAKSKKQYDFLFGNIDDAIDMKSDEEYIADHLIANDVTVQKWISVKDRLPKREDANLYESVLAINKEDGVPRSWIWDIVVDYPKEFTHWMPLPEPPKGE